MHGYGGNSDRNARIAMESRRLLATGSESLERSMRIVNDIENQGTDILSSLGEQRDQIRNTREKLNDVDGDLRTSRNILSRMEWREIYNKVILVVIILILIVFIIVFLYFQLR
jgi:CHASE3 domain sensor protein